jgi:hypothetical protein
MAAGATILAVLLLLVAPAHASAYWSLDSTTGWMQWLENGGVQTGVEISQDTFNHMANAYVAAGQEMFNGAAVPSDIATADATAGVSAWDSLANVGSSSLLKTEAMDAMGAEGAWAGLGAVMPTFALGAGVFYVGWQIGAAIDNLLGIDTGSGSTFQGSYTTTATSVTYAPAGTDLNSFANYCSGSPCTSLHPSVATGSWVVKFSTSTGTTYDAHEISGWSADNGVCDYVVNNTPPGGSWVVVTITSLDEGTGCTNVVDRATGRTVACTLCMQDEVYVIPATTVSPPGPGQMIPSPAPSIVTTQYIGPNEDGKKRGAVRVLTNPMYDPWNRYFCDQFPQYCGGGLPVGRTYITIPAITPNETYAQYVAALQQAGFLGKVSNTVLSDTAADPTRAPLSVVQVTPAPGTQADPQATVTVTTNPAATPTVGAAAPVGPSLPGISFPSAGTPCNVFPFGVPCWLGSQLQSVASASPTAPSFTVGMPHFGSGCSGNACDLNVNLDHPFGADLGAIMQIVRPILLVLSFIGIAVWLAGLAMGGSTSGGGGEDD